MLPSECYHWIGLMFSLMFWACEAFRQRARALLTLYRRRQTRFLGAVLKLAVGTLELSSTCMDKHRPVRMFLVTWELPSW